MHAFSGDIAKGSIRYIYIFMELFVPLVTAFYVMFGGSVNVQKMTAKIGEDNDVLSFSSLDRMVSQTNFYALQTTSMWQILLRCGKYYYIYSILFVLVDRFHGHS